MNRRLSIFILCLSGLIPIAGTPASADCLARSLKLLRAREPRAVTARDAERLIDESEGKPGIANVPGHAREHIPKAGQDPAEVVRARTEAQAKALNAGLGKKVRDQTSVYRRPEQAYEDIADIMQQLAPELKNLQPGTELPVRRFRLKSARTGLDSTRTTAKELAEYAKLKLKDTFCVKLPTTVGCWKIHAVQFDVVQITISRTLDGKLHLEHFTPIINDLGADPTNSPSIIERKQ